VITVPFLRKIAKMNNPIEREVTLRKSLASWREPISPLEQQIIPPLGT